MKHPNEAELVLHASGDLPWFSAWRVNRHVQDCAECNQLAHRYQTDREQLNLIGNELPPEVNWNRLSVEMAANIRVGLAAGECVASPGVLSPRFNMIALAICGVVVCLMSAGWLLNVPRRAAMTESALTLQPTANGVSSRQDGRSLILNAPKGTTTLLSSEPDVVGQRYVDDQSGQVQIVKVYAQ